MNQYRISYHWRILMKGVTIVQQCHNKNGIELPGKTTRIVLLYMLRLSHMQ